MKNYGLVKGAKADFLFGNLIFEDHHIFIKDGLLRSSEFAFGLWAWLCPPRNSGEIAKMANVMATSKTVVLFMDFLLLLWVRVEQIPPDVGAE
ncbi:MAG: hypothetical protein ABR556_14455 [Pyrinomonadaceae bacterium]